MKKALLWGFAGLIVLLAFGVLFVNTPPGRSLLASALESKTGRKVELRGHIYPIALWPPALRITKATMENMEGGRADAMARIGRMEVALAPRPLFRYGLVRLHRLTLINSELNLERNKGGEANWDFLNSDKKTTNDERTPFHLAFLSVENSRFTYLDVPQKTDIALTGAEEGDQLTLKGDGQHLGKAFKVEGAVPRTCLSRRARACPVNVTLNVGKTSLTAKGTLDAVVPPVGADFILDIKGASASELFPLFGIALPPTPPYELKGHLTYKDEVWNFDDFTGRMGESDLQGNLAFDMSGERNKLTAKFISKKLRFVDLGPLVGLKPGQTESPYALPDVPLDISRLESMDADVEFTGKQIVSTNLPLEDFYMKADLDNRLLKLNPVKFGSAGGKITAEITVDARQNPVRDEAKIRFYKLSLAGLMENSVKRLNVARPEGDFGGNMHLVGSGKSLHEMMGNSDGVAGLGMEGGSISNLLVKLLSLDVARSLGFLLKGDEPLPIRCVVATFNVKNGIMRPDTFVIDTKDTIITADGTVNLKDESMNIRFFPAPKKATLISLRSPIDIEGTLKHPDVNIAKGPLAARGAIATGLAALAPVAGALALFDVGTGKDSNCPALIDHLQKVTGTNDKTDGVPKN